MEMDIVPEECSEGREFLLFSFLERGWVEGVGGPGAEGREAG